ncbi:hypothetical protein R1flu_014419 [Riccia fluitans]|uniref:Uncharacterized protein n=1 Tax=Riccia fluitans TaxID=41844 RepID=A0ABD1YG25_9MARC
MGDLAGRTAVGHVGRACRRWRKGMAAVGHGALPAAALRAGRAGALRPAAIAKILDIQLGSGGISIDDLDREVQEGTRVHDKIQEVQDRVQEAFFYEHGFGIRTRKEKELELPE